MRSGTGSPGRSPSSPRPIDRRDPSYDERPVVDSRSTRVNRVAVRLTLVACLASIAVFGASSPAGATTTVVADARFKWFYWIGFLLAASLVLWLLGMTAMYVARIVRPKWRGRPQS